MKKLCCLSIISVFAIVQTSAACELACSCNVTQTAAPKTASIHLGLAEQFTHFGDVREDGHKIDNVADQNMDSSITTVFASYDLNDRTSFQINLPYISRDFKRFENEMSESGTEEGLGDAVIFAKYVLLEKKDALSAFRIQVFGGVKLPTGDSDRLGEEQAMAPAMEMEHALPHHGGHHDEEIASAIHGHDLALGSGSYDFPVGINVYGKRERLIFNGNLQYVFRTEGDFDYRYADDLTWNMGPAYEILSNDNLKAALGINLSGEIKGKDEANGETEADTGIRSLYAGPALTVAIGDSLAAEVALELPLEQHNTGIQSVPTYRARAGLTYRF